MGEVVLEARHVLVGDSLWMYDTCRQEIAQGNKVSVVCTHQNKGMYEFFRDYCVGTESLEIKDYWTGPTKISGGSAPMGGELLPLRKPLEPIVSDSRYVVFQPESAGHNKFKNSLRALRAGIIPGYSVGVTGEQVLQGTQAFHSRPISEVARLIYHSIGVVAIFSSMSLLASLLGKKVLCVGYEGLSIGKDVAPTGFPEDRCRFEEGQPHEVAQAVLEHIGPCLEGHPQ